MTDTHTIVSLPLPLTHLVGRDNELARLVELLTGPARLVSITGIGGIGKTRLALQVALELEPQFQNGVLMVPLAEFRSANVIGQEILRMLGQNHADGDVNTVILALGSNARLLVLDNLEQIPDAGDLITQILAKQPSLTVLCTSQVPLRVPGEQIYALDPMPLPVETDDIDRIRESPAVEMFIQRALAADARLMFSENDVRMIGKICVRLEGIPLAIELAAPRITVLPPEALLNRLSHRFDVLGGGSPHTPDRLRTMRNAISWTYDLLSPDEQRIFRYLGAFADSIGVEAIEHILATLESTHSAWDLIESFANRSLIRRTEAGESPRYTMLQTLREFAVEQLEAEGEGQSAKLALSRFVVVLAEEAESHLSGDQQSDWFRKLSAEQENIRRACEWSAVNRPELLLRVIAAIWRYFELSYLAVHYSELGHAVDPGSVDDEGLVARALLGVGSMDASTFNGVDRALSTLQRAELSAGQVADHRTMSRAHNAQGAIQRHLGKHELALSHFEQAVEYARMANRDAELYSALANISLLSYDMQDYHAAIARLTEALPIGERIGNVATVNRGRLALGMYHNQLKEFDRATEYLSDVMVVARQTGNMSDQFFATNMLIDSAVGLADFDLATRCYKECLDIATKVGTPYFEACARGTYLEAILARGGQHAEVDAATELVALANVLVHGEFTDGLLVGSSIAIGLSHRIGHMEEAASVLGAYTAWRQHSNYQLTDHCEYAVQAVLDVLPISPRDPVRIAFNTGKTWSYEEFRIGILRAAQAYLRRVEIEPIAPPPPTTPAPEYRLTPREVDVLRAMADGSSNVDIASQMFISSRTISTHVSNILAKLEVSSRTAAVSLAMRDGII